MSRTAREMTSAHWGTYEVERAAGATAPATGLRALAEDADPSPVGLAMLDAYRHGPRVLRPAVRRSWLEHGPGTRTELRGREPFVQVSWEEVSALVAADLRRVIQAHGHEALFAGSYGWSSAGRFHHGQSQTRRFFNLLGGCVRHVDTYSLGAGRVVMPHIVGDMGSLMVDHHDWETMAAHTRLFVSFGGVPRKNGQVNAGGASLHHVHAGMQKLAAAGCRFVNFSPVRSDIEVPAAQLEWIPLRPGSDTAVMLALATEIILAGRHNRAFLASHCTGFERWERYLLGQDDGVAKTAEWAAPLADVSADRLRALALEMTPPAHPPGAAGRTWVNVAWSLQRAEHGEQPFWGAVGLAAVIGHIGQPGGGFGCYGPANAMGSNSPLVPGPSFPLGRNPIDRFIPCARIADMLLQPGELFDYNGASYRYPDVKLVYWVGGNPFHHHQDLNKLLHAWRRPQTIVVHEQVWNAQARHADIVLPASSTLEREDIGYAHLDPLLVAMKPLHAAPGQARDDHAIFAGIAGHLGLADALTEGRSPRDWLRVMWDAWRHTVAPLLKADVPNFDSFWQAGHWWMPRPAHRRVTMFGDFRADPQSHALPTPSGRIELFSARVAEFGYSCCPGHAAWLPPAEWLGSREAARHPLHLISDQPATRLHSQLDFSAHSVAGKVAGREPVWLHPADAQARGILAGDVVELFNDRGACQAGAVLTEAVRPGVVKLSTGAWWDPATPGEPGSPCRHGNPNVLTRDVGASKLSQGCSAQSCLVQVIKAVDPSAAAPFRLPELLG